MTRLASISTPWQDSAASATVACASVVCAARSMGHAKREEMGSGSP